MGTVNTTTLARRFGMTTKDTEKRLASLGISPAQEMIQPSGKRFVLWPAEESVAALEAYKAERAELRLSRPAPKPSPAKETAEELKAEVQELKRMLQTLLENQAKPIGH